MWAVWGSGSGSESFLEQVEQEFILEQGRLYFRGTERRLLPSLGLNYEKKKLSEIFVSLDILEFSHNID